LRKAKSYRELIRCEPDVEYPPIAVLASKSHSTMAKMICVPRRDGDEIKFKFTHPDLFAKGDNAVTFTAAMLPDGIPSEVFATKRNHGRLLSDRKTFGILARLHQQTFPTLAKFVADLPIKHYGMHSAARLAKEAQLNARAGIVGKHKPYVLPHDERQGQSAPSTGYDSASGSTSSSSSSPSSSRNSNATAADDDQRRLQQQQQQPPSSPGAVTTPIGEEHDNRAHTRHEQRSLRSAAAGASEAEAAATTRADATGDKATDVSSNNATGKLSPQQQAL